MKNEPLEDVLREKRDRLLENLSQSGRVAVAYSAGVDSTVLAKAARTACGDNALAVIAESPSLPSGTIEEATELAELIKIPLVVLQTEEFSDPDYRANLGNRCYFCKDTLYRLIEENRSQLQYDVVVNGANVDDLSDHRPGHLAAEQYQVRSPFVEAEISKREIRELAKYWKLPIWNKPASPCLSSRIAYGLEVTAERVKRVDRAESFLKEQLDIGELRVRHEHHDLARIEIPSSGFCKLMEQKTREQIVKTLKDFGFKYITLDLNGFQSGSMNQVLPLESLTQRSNS